MREPVYLEDVFKLSGIPTITFVEPNEYKHLYVSIRTAGRGVIIRAIRYREDDLRKTGY